MIDAAARARGLHERLSAAVGQPVLSVVPAECPGYMAAHYRASLADGTSVFVKEATTDFSRGVLQGEIGAYQAIGQRPFLPAVIGHDEDLMVIEDLSHAYWPPPWREDDLTRVESILHEIVDTRPPDTLRSLDHGPWSGSWSRIAEDPNPLLSLGLCTTSWLDRALDPLIAADGCSLSGEALVHGDFRSDNLCILGDHVVVVDWAGAAKGRSDYDRTSFAIPTAIETGQTPENIAPRADPALVTTLASRLACHAPNPRVPTPIREQLTAQLSIALPWCARILDLPPP